MVFRYRGLLMLASDPGERPLVLRVYDPLRPTEVMKEFRGRTRYDTVIRRACAYVDGSCAEEAARAAEQFADR